MALGIIYNIYKRKKASKLVHFFSFFTPSEHAVTEKVTGSQSGLPGQGLAKTKRLFLPRMDTKIVIHSHIAQLSYLSEFM